MTVAVPIDAQGQLYRLNPVTASHFAIYESTTHNRRITLKYVKTIESREIIKPTDLKTAHCECNAQDKDRVEHISAHYMLLETLGSCDYLLSHTFCSTLSKALDTGHVSIFKIPPIIRHIENALSNFIIAIKPAVTFSDITVLTA